MKSPLASLKPRVTFELGGNPDWLKVTRNAVWVSNSTLGAVQRIDPKTDTVVATIALGAPPCSGLAFGFGSLWVPLAGMTPALARIDAATNEVVARLPVGSGDSEGGIAADATGVWMVIDSRGTLVRIDPSTESIVQRMKLDAGSFNPIAAHGTIWVTERRYKRLVGVRASTGRILAPTDVGREPRFLTYGNGSIWTLNQGDGTISRVDAETRRLVATIAVGLRGQGGGICFGAGSVWATLFGTPLTRINANTNRVVHQWTGPGGDSVALGHESIWLTDYEGGLLWRIPLAVVRDHSR